MSKFLLTFIVIVFCVTNVPGQLYPGARQIAMSSSDVALSDDAFSLFTNPAGLSQMNWREIGIYYSPAPFGLNELANGFGAYHEPTKFGSFGIGFMTYGFDLYKENKFILSYSNNYSNRLFFGLSIIYNSLSIQNYGNDAAISFLIGGLVYLNSELRIGFSVENITRSSYSAEDDQIPVRFRTGVSYNVIDELSVNLALIKEINFPVSTRFGLEYSIIKYLTIRFGVGNEPSRYSTGLGIHYSIFSLDYAFFTHQNLGFTHQFGLLISFGKNQF